jgi:hypothetical protein
VRGGAPKRHKSEASQVIRIRNNIDDNGSVKLAKDLLRHVEDVLGEDLYAVLIDLLSAVHEVIGLHIGQLVGEALAIETFLLLARGMRVVPEGNNNTSKAVILAVGNPWLVLLGAAEEAKLVLLIDKAAKVFVQVRKRSGVERFLVCHF